ncbi:chlorophyll a/b-binding protein [Leptothoe spongobia]|nr:chlorophyll a/b-binding protein [Leptothoe spongobia]
MGVTHLNVSFEGFRIMAEDKAKFGFTQIAENWNGRLAMLGFIIGLATELMTGQGILSQIGIM